MVSYDYAMPSRVFDCRDRIFIDPHSFNAVLADVGGLTYLEVLGENL